MERIIKVGSEWYVALRNYGQGPSIETTDRQSEATRFTLTEVDAAGGVEAFNRALSVLLPGARLVRLTSRQRDESPIPATTT